MERLLGAASMEPVVAIVFAVLAELRAALALFTQAFQPPAEFEVMVMPVPPPEMIEPLAMVPRA